MLLLNDIRQVQEVKVPSTLDTNYKWVLMPYTDNDLMFMLIHEPPLPALNPWVSLNSWAMPQPKAIDPIEVISVSRAADIFSLEKAEELTEVSARHFAEWLVVMMTIRIKQRLLDVGIEDDNDYPFVKRFYRDDYTDQGLHAIANCITSDFYSLFSHSKVH